MAKLHARMGSLLEQTGRESEALQSFDKALEKYQRVVRIELSKAKSDAPRKPLHLYDAACFLSCCVPIAKRKADQDRYADEAMQTLRLAVAAGWGSRGMGTARSPLGGLVSCRIDLPVIPTLSPCTIAATSKALFAIVRPGVSDDHSLPDHACDLENLGFRTPTGRRPSVGAERSFFLVRENPDSGSNPPRVCGKLERIGRPMRVYTR